MDNNGIPELVAASSKRGEIHVLVSKTGRFDKSIQFTVVQPRKYGGKIRSLQVIDMDGDGNDDILYTLTGYHGLGSVECYISQGSLIKNRWHRATIMAGIRTLVEGLHDALPGSAIAYLLSEYNEGGRGKPNIILSGGGSWKTYLLKPNEYYYGPRLRYTPEKLGTCGGAAGTLGVGWIKEANRFAAFAPCQQVGKVLNFFI